jgi:aspartate/methionine/tyrosine aminotransferase
MLLPERLRAAVGALTGNFTICPPSVAQLAAVAAFEPASYAEVDRHVARYRVNRDVLLTGLPELGIDRLAPADGGFYVYADVSHLTADSMEFCRRLLADTGVAIAPGIDFDPVHGGRFVRLSYAGPTADMHEALARLKDWLGTERAAGSFAQ